MDHARPKQYFAAAHRVIAYGGAIEWEELPSLAQHLITRRTPRPAGTPTAADSEFADPSSFGSSAWDETTPMRLDESDVTTAPAEFRDALGGGLATREVTAPDVFRHFFGQRGRR